MDSPSLPPLFDPPYFNTNRASSSFINDNERSATSARASDGIHMSFTGIEDLQDHKILLPNHLSQMDQQANPCNLPHASLLNPLLSLPGSGNSDYLNQVRNNSIPNLPTSGYTTRDLTILRALAATREASGLCKVEQFSNQSMVSQETGLSTDVNTEISSVASKHEMGRSRCYENLEGPSSAGPIDLECLWNY